MKKPVYKMLPAYKESENFPYPYVCTLSPIFRMAVKLTGADLRPHAEAIVRDFEESKELCDSLKVYQPVVRIIRQVDLKDDNGNILAKCFMWWDCHNEHWVVMMEGSDEQYWEKNQVNEGMN